MKTMTIRNIPDSVAAGLAESAHSSGRSMNATAVAALAEAFGKKPHKKPKNDFSAHASRTVIRHEKRYERKHPHPGGTGGAVGADVRAVPAGQDRRGAGKAVPEIRVPEQGSAVVQIPSHVLGIRPRRTVRVGADLRRSAVPVARPAMQSVLTRRGRPGTAKSRKAADHGLYPRRTK